MAKATADYSHAVTELNGHGIIVIEDLNRGNRSVTNDIENVVEDIAQKEGINPVEHYIIYMDSDREWSGYNFSTRTSLPLSVVEEDLRVSDIIKQLKISS